MTRDEINHLESEVHQELLDLLSKEGPKRAYRMATQWIEAAAQTQRDKLRTLVAIRGLPGLAQQCNDASLSTEAHAELLSLTADSSKPQAMRYEALCALLGVPHCYDERDPVSFLRHPRLNEYPNPLAIDAQDRARMCQKGCPVDVLTQWGMWKVVSPGGNVVEVLKQLALEPHITPPDIPVSAAAVLATFDPELAAQVAAERYRDSDDESFSFRLTRILTADGADEGPIYESIIHAASTSPTFSTRKGIIRALALNDPVQGRQPVNVLRQGVQFISEEGTSSTKDAMELTLSIVRYLDQQWSPTFGLDTSAELAPFATFVSETAPIYRDAIQALVMLPGGSGISSGWGSYLQDNYWGDEYESDCTIRVEGVELSHPLGRHWNDLFLETLYANYEWPRSRKMIEIIEGIKAGLVDRSTAIGSMDDEE